jgi:hypothetical protein
MQSKKKPAKYIEHQIQIAIVSFFRCYYKDKIHIIGSDGTSKSAREGDKKNKLGYEKGNPDLIIFSKIKPIVPLLIELKRPKSEGRVAGKESTAQKLKRKQFTEIGYSWIVIDNLEKGVNEIKKYFDL